jgi:ATP-dependent DNA helicase RecQ
MKRAEWQAIGRELIRLGYLRQGSERFTVLELTTEGRAALAQRKKITLTKPAVVPEQMKHRAGEIPCDEALFERLRTLRRTLADARDVPAYIIFSDVALREMANKYPASEAEFGRIAGVGKQKLREFAQVFLAEIADHLRTTPRQVFADSFTAPPPAKRSLGDSVRETLRRFRTGATIEQIARERGFVANTIYGHLAEAIEAGERFELDKVITSEQERLIAAAFAQVTFGGLKEIKELLGDKVNYGQLRIFRAARASHA